MIDTDTLDNFLEVYRGGNISSVLIDLGWLIDYESLGLDPLPSLIIESLGQTLITGDYVSATIQHIARWLEDCGFPKSSYNDTTDSYESNIVDDYFGFDTVNKLIEDIMTRTYNSLYESVGHVDDYVLVSLINDEPESDNASGYYLVVHSE